MYIVILRSSNLTITVARSSSLVLKEPLSSTRKHTNLARWHLQHVGNREVDLDWGGLRVPPFAVGVLAL